MTARTALCLLALLGSTVASAVESEPPAESTLHRVGTSVQRHLIFDIYRVTLFLEHFTPSAKEVLEVDQPKRIDLTMMRNGSRQQISKALADGLKRSASPDLVAAVQDRFTQLLSAIPDLRRGDRLRVTYLPGLGTTLESGDKVLTIPGHDFQQAFFSIWLGNDPATARIKRELLGG